MLLCNVVNSTNARQLDLGYIRWRWHFTQSLSEELKPALLTELLLLIGWYQGLAGVLNTSGIELDEALEKVVAEHTAI